MDKKETSCCFRLAQVVYLFVVIGFAGYGMYHYYITHGLVPRWGSRHEPGTLIVHVSRIVSDAFIYDQHLPDLQFEVEVNNLTAKSQIYYAKKEFELSEGFSFERVDWNGAVFLRIRDVSYDHKPIRGMMAITPSKATLGQYAVYQMDKVTWVVMKVDFRDL